MPPRSCSARTIRWADRAWFDAGVYFAGSQPTRRPARSSENTVKYRNFRRRRIEWASAVRMLVARGVAYPCCRRQRLSGNDVCRMIRDTPWDAKHRSSRSRAGRTRRHVIKPRPTASISSSWSRWILRYSSIGWSESNSNERPPSVPPQETGRRDLIAEVAGGRSRVAADLPELRHERHPRT
jgi:hypothetical protein